MTYRWPDDQITPAQRGMLDSIERHMGKMWQYQSILDEVRGLVYTDGMDAAESLYRISLVLDANDWGRDSHDNEWGKE